MTHLAVLALLPLASAGLAVASGVGDCTVEGVYAIVDEYVEVNENTRLPTGAKVLFAGRIESGYVFQYEGMTPLWVDAVLLPATPDRGRYRVTVTREDDGLWQVKGEAVYIKIATPCFDAPGLVASSLGEEAVLEIGGAISGVGTLTFTDSY